MQRKSFIFLTAMLYVAVSMLACGDDPASPTIVITNLKNNATLESGFLTGHVSGATALSYEVSWDDGGSWSPIAGSDAFRIRIPLSWRTGWYYSLRIRAVTAEGTTGQSEFTLRKGHNRDWNGDGYPDLVITEPGYNTFTGRVLIFNGGGAPGVTPQVELDLRMYYPTEGNRSPFFVQADFNGDGYGDIALFNYDTSAFQIYSGSSSNLVQTSTVTNGSLTGNLAAGDFNGDGYTDLALASTSSANGSVVVLLADTTNGIRDTDLGSDTPDWSGAGEAVNAQFGSGLAAGDFNRDGYDDLAVGARYLTTDPGRVYVYYSSWAGLSSSADTTIDGSTASSRFGDMVTSADFNGDGYADIAVGAFSRDDNGSGLTNAGLVQVHAGSASGISVSAFRTYLGENMSKIGAFLAGGDIDGDGYDELAVYAGGQQIPGTGRVFLYRGSSDGPQADAWRTLTGETNGNYFGCHLHLSDLNGDGFADLYVLDSGCDWDGTSGPYQGKFYWYRGSASGIGTDPDWEMTGYVTED